MAVLLSGSFNPKGFVFCVMHYTFGILPVVLRGSKGADVTEKCGVLRVYYRSLNSQHYNKVPG